MSLKVSVPITSDSHNTDVSDDLEISYSHIEGSVIFKLTTDDREVGVDVNILEDILRLFSGRSRT
jgi:hypothetical protein